MENYKIWNETKKEMKYLYIHEIIIIIKQNPQQIFYKYIDDNKVLINNDIVVNTTFICHRINTINELNSIPEIFGIELDIRDTNYNKKLFLAHDPYINGEDFENYLKEYHHNTLILNIKSERTEPLCIELMHKYNIHKYFFLDSTTPMMYLLSKTYDNHNIACRFSEFEPIEYYNTVQNMVSWVWVDCFTEQPLTRELYDMIKKNNTKICIVSPELQQQPNKIKTYRDHFISNNILPDAICCKLYNIIHWI